MSRDVEEVRAFNRFHTRLVGALSDHLLESNYALPQVRVLYEVAQAPRGKPYSASELAGRLRLDAGYVCRLVAGLESEGLIARAPSRENAKRLTLSLTDHGREAFARLNDASSKEVAGLLEPLSPVDRRALTGCMRRIRRLLGDVPHQTTFILRDPGPGDLGHIISRQACLYADEYGWDWTYEGLVAEIVGQFVKNFDREKEQCWIAEWEGEVVGSVFVVRGDSNTAKLRLLYVEPSARGHGLGRHLVDECIRFARAKGYRKMVLWTNDCLVSARRIYQATDFMLTNEEPHRSFGKDLVGQYWELTL